MRLLIGILVIVLLVAHQDYWNWDDASLMFGFLPIGLFYHLGISLAAAVVWVLAVTWAWPQSAIFSNEQSTISATKVPNTENPS